MQHPQCTGAKSCLKISPKWSIPTWVNSRGRSRKCSIKNLFRQTDRAQWVSTNLWTAGQKRTFSVFIRAQWIQNELFLWGWLCLRDGACTKQPTKECPWRGSCDKIAAQRKNQLSRGSVQGRSPAQLFLMATHWQEGKLFLTVHFFQTRTHKKKTGLSPRFVSNLQWPAFKAVSGCPAQKLLEEWPAGPSAAGSPIHRPPGWTRPQNTVAK